MSGNQMGYIKGKLNVQGKTQPGELIARMNAMKNGTKCKTCGAMYKDHANVQHKFDPMGIVSGVESGLGRVGQAISSGVKFAGQVGKAFVRNATGGDIKMMTQSKKTKRHGKKS